MYSPLSQKTDTILPCLFFFWLGFTTSWRRKWQPTPVLLPGKFHGQRSLVGYGPWGYKEPDTTEQLHSPQAAWRVQLANQGSYLCAPHWEYGV